MALEEASPLPLVFVSDVDEPRALIFLRSSFVADHLREVMSMVSSACCFADNALGWFAIGP